MDTQREYRFFYHFVRRDKKLSVHFRGECIHCDNVVCYAPCESKWNNAMPILVMQGYAESISIEGSTVYIGKN